MPVTKDRLKKWHKDFFIKDLVERLINANAGLIGAAEHHRTIKDTVKLLTKLLEEGDAKPSE